MAHGFIGLGPKEFGYLAATLGFSYYLSTGFRGPDRPKYEVDPAIALMAKETQPGIVPEHYFRREKK